MLNDFKAFLSRGNVVELAVAVVIGGAFGKIVSSLVDDLVRLLALDPKAGVRLPHTEFDTDSLWHRRWEVFCPWVTGSAVTQAHRVHGWLWICLADSYQ